MERRRGKKGDQDIVSCGCTKRERGVSIDRGEKMGGIGR